MTTPVEPIRYTPEAIDARREKVWDLTIRGLGPSAIADVLAVHRNTVSSDIKHLREEAGKKISELDVLQSIGVVCKKLDMLTHMAMMDYQDCKEKEHLAKNAFLHRMQALIKDKVNLLVRTGIYPHAGIKFSGQITMEEKLPFTDRFGEGEISEVLEDAAKRRRIMSALGTLMQTAIRHPAILDITPIEET